MKKTSKKDSRTRKKDSSVTLDKGHEKERDVFYKLIDSDGDLESAVEQLKNIVNTQVSQ